VVAVAVFIGAYLPGFKAGGPIISVSRIIEHEGDQSFRVITRDRDLGETSKYPDTSPRRWNSVGKAKVAYLGPRLRDLVWITQQLRDDPPEIYYLNSLQSPWFSLLPLLAIKTRLLPPRPVVVAPRGETSPGARALKSRKKSTWRPVIKWLIGTNVTWHASSSMEESEVNSWWRGELPSRHRVVIWPDLAVAPSPHVSLGCQGPIPVITFASRIDRMKGLHEAIKILSRVTVPYRFCIYGDATDAGYWRECQELANRLLPSGSWEYFGTYLPGEALEIFAHSNVFLFPTQGENFGHVITEALAVGCPVVISPTTQWTPVIESGGGVVIRNTEQAAESLDNLLRTSNIDSQAVRRSAHCAYRKWFDSLDHVGFKTLNQIQTD